MHVSVRSWAREQGSILSSDKLHSFYFPWPSLCLCLRLCVFFSPLSSPHSIYSSHPLMCISEAPHCLSSLCSLSRQDEMRCINVMGANMDVSKVSGPYYVVILREENT